MSQVTITINSREYAVACEDGQEVRIYQLARMLDEKAKMITQGVGQINENMLLAMVGLLLADELTEAKKGVVAVPATPALDEGKLLDLDKDMAAKIKLLGEQINSVASAINLM